MSKKGIGFGTMNIIVPDGNRKYVVNVLSIEGSGTYYQYMGKTVLKSNHVSWWDKDGINAEFEQNKESALRHVKKIYDEVDE